MKRSAMWWITLCACSAGDPASSTVRLPAEQGSPELLAPGGASSAQPGAANTPELLPEGDVSGELPRNCGLQTF